MNPEIKRTMDNLSRMQSWTTTLNIDAVNEWLEKHSDLIFCNGRGRRVVFEKITDKMYRVYTKAI